MFEEANIHGMLKTQENNLASKRTYRLIPLWKREW